MVCSWVDSQKSIQIDPEGPSQNWHVPLSVVLRCIVHKSSLFFDIQKKSENISSETGNVVRSN